MKRSKHFTAKTLMLMGLALICFMLLSAILAPALVKMDPLQMDLAHKLEFPNPANWFGTDQNGSDIFARIIYGARVSLGVSLSVVCISMLIGLVLGSLAGWVGGWTDTLIMRTIDVLYAFPGFLLAIAMVAMLGPSIRNLIIALCLTGWTSFARLVRAEFLHIKQRDFVQSSRALGASSIRLVVIHCWPSLYSLLIVQMTFSMAGTVIAESGLSFLGLGTPPSTPSWGALLSSGRNYLFEAPFISIFPGIAIFLMVLSFNLLGDGLRDFLDPKSNR